MKTETQINLLWFLIFILFTTTGVLCILLKAAKATEGQCLPVERIVEVKVPMSVRELQTFLNEQPDPWKRYVCTVDGIFGTETEKSLSNWLCDQHVKKELGQ